MTHWSHPSFFSYFPSNNTDVTIISEIFKTAFHNPGFDWKCSPANTELETVVSDWICRGLGLDEKFLFSNKGGGIIANTISEGCFIVIQNAKRLKM